MELPIYENSAPVGTLHIFPQGLYTVFEASLPAKPPLPKGGCPSAHTGAGGYPPPPAEAQSCPRATARVAPTALAAPNSAFPLTRLWLADESGAAAPLGLLEPRGEGRVLRRRFTRLELRRLPAHPARALALPDGERPPAPAAPAAPNSPSSPVPTSLRTSDRRAWCGNPSPVGEGYAPPAASGARPTAGRASPAPTAQSAHVPVGAGALDGPPCPPRSSVSGQPIAAPAVPPPPSPQNSNLKTQNSASPWRPQPDGSLVDPERRLLALPWAGGEPPAPARKISLNGRDYLLFRY